jgi:8-oxo-dGTP diphosphatase
VRDPLSPVLHVVAGVLYDAFGRMLIAQRPEGKALAGRWEFPGGKVAPGEPAFDALRRELREELGVAVETAARLMLYAVSYPGRTIWLDVWIVQHWHGVPAGLDAQALEWVAREHLRAHDILEADAAIVAALERLPSPALRATSPADAGEVQN